MVIQGFEFFVVVVRHFTLLLFLCLLVIWFGALLFVLYVGHVAILRRYRGALKA